MIEQFEAGWPLLQTLIIFGFTIGVILAVVVGAIRVGWKLAPYIFVGAAFLYFFGG